MVGSVRVKPIDGRVGCHDVFINGIQIDNVRSLDFHVDPESIPEVDLTVLGNLDYNGLAVIGLNLTPESVVECISGLKLELMLNDDLRKAFLASIKSALDDAKNYVSNEKLSEQILDRILGEESDVGISDYRDID